MRTTKILLLLTFLILSCGEQEAGKQAQGEAVSQRVIEVLELRDSHVWTPAEIAETLDLSTSDILLCRSDHTFDGGSHRWIYRFDDLGQFSHAILFRWSDHEEVRLRRNPRPSADGKERTLEVFRETVSNDKLLRIALTTEEAMEDLAEIEAYLVAFLGEKTYRAYYQGAIPEEPETKNGFGDQSSGERLANLESKSSRESRELANAHNHDTARRIATMIRNYRKVAGVEPPRAELHSEGGDQPQPEAEGRAR